MLKFKVVSVVLPANAYAPIEVVLVLKVIDEIFAFLNALLEIVVTPVALRFIEVSPVP